MGTETWIALLAVVLSPIGGLVAAVFVNRRAKEKNVVEGAVSTQEAETNEFAVLTEGYKASYERMGTELQGALGRIEQLGKDLVAQGSITADAVAKLEQANRLIATLSTQKYTLEEEKNRILYHLSTVEAAFPNPPGPPTRPEDWHLTKRVQP